jgi:hypothetical protein
MPTMMPLTQPTSPSSYAPSIYPLTPSDTVTRQKTLRRKSAFKTGPIWVRFAKKRRELPGKIPQRLRRGGLPGDNTLPDARRLRL